MTVPSPSPDLVERFHRVLVEEILRSRPEYLDRPFTVAEIYQSLVPYRTHRDRLGVEMNGDYEDLLLRLLAGEGERVTLESEPARRRIRSELEQPHPNTGIYRDFAAVEVRLNPAAIPDEVSPPISEPEPVPQAPSRSVREEAPFPSTAAGGAPSPSVGGDRSADTAVPGTCPECSEELPARESLRFCPACGTNVFVKPCSSCGEDLERTWRYCVACGTPTGG